MRDDAEWSDVLLEDLAAPTRNALVGGPFGSDLVSSDYTPAGVPVIRGENLSCGRWVAGEFVFVSPTKAQRLAANTAGPLDLVFTQRGANHYRQVALVHANAGQRFVISQSQMKITVDRQKADPLFVYYLFRAPRQQEYLQRHAIQTGVPHTNLSILRKTPLRLPPLEKQQTIAKILGALDDKIEQNRRMNETLEAIARAIFKSWFVDFDPVRAKAEGRQPAGMDAETAALFPDTFEESEVGEVPAGWQLRSFAETVEVIGGGTPKTSTSEYWNGDIPWFSVVDAPSDSDVWAVDTVKKITRAGVENSAARVLSVGTTIISARGTVGKVALVGAPMAMNQSCYGLRGRIGTRGYYTYFSTRDLVSTLRQHAHGSVFDTITRDTLAVSVVSPPAEVIDAFEQLVSPILVHIRAAVLGSRTLSDLRDVLLPKLISGELRAKDAARLAETAL